MRQKYITPQGLQCQYQAVKRSQWSLLWAHYAPGKQVLRVCCAAVSDCWSVLYLPQNNINDQLQALALLENALAVAGAMHVAYFDTDTDDPG